MEVSTCHGYESGGLKKVCATDINLGIIGICVAFNAMKWMNFPSLLSFQK